MTEIMDEETRRKSLFWFLIIFTFIVLIIFWQFLLKIFPPKIDRVVMQNIDFYESMKKSFNQLLNRLKEIKIIPFSTKIETKKGLTNEELEKLKEKVLKHLNQE